MVMHVSRFCSNVVDFDDLLSLAVALLRDENVAATFRRRYRYLLVDEFQVRFLYCCPCGADSESERKFRCRRPCTVKSRSIFATSD